MFLGLCEEITITRVYFHESEISRCQTISNNNIHLEYITAQRFTDVYRKIAKGPKGLRVKRLPVKISNTYYIIKFHTIKKENEKRQKKK